MESPQQPRNSGVNAGWYNVNNKAFALTGNLGDHQSLVPGARDLRELFRVGP